MSKKYTRLQNNWADEDYKKARKELLGDSNSKEPTIHDTEQSLLALRKRIQKLGDMVSQLRYAKDDSELQNIKTKFIYEKENCIALCKEIMVQIRHVESTKEQLKEQQRLSFAKIKVQFQEEFENFQRVVKEGNSINSSRVNAAQKRKYAHHLAWWNAHQYFFCSEPKTLLEYEKPEVADDHQKQEEHVMEQTYVIYESTENSRIQKKAIAIETRTDLLSLDENMNHLQQSYTQLYEMIIGQGEHLDQIYANMKEVKKNTSEAIIEIKSANTAQENGSWMTRVLLVLVVLTILVVAAIVDIALTHPFG